VTIAGRILVFVAVLIAGCSTTVTETTLSSDPSYYWLGSSAGSARDIFLTTDEKGVLRVVFAPNFLGSVRAFTVHWLAPDGSLYLAAPAKTKWGSRAA
jgi:hypothetical protein